MRIAMMVSAIGLGFAGPMLAPAALMGAANAQNQNLQGPIQPTQARTAPLPAAEAAAFNTNVSRVLSDTQMNDAQKAAYIGILMREASDPVSAALTLLQGAVSADTRAAAVIMGNAVGRLYNDLGTAGDPQASELVQLVQSTGDQTIRESFSQTPANQTTGRTTVQIAEVSAGSQDTGDQNNGTPTPTESTTTTNDTPVVVTPRVTTPVVVTPVVPVPPQGQVAVNAQQGNPTIPQIGGGNPSSPT